MTLETIRQWVEDCVSSHPECRLGVLGEAIGPNAPLPTRVIDVRTYGRCDQPPLLVETEDQTGCYVALSHCWGGHSQVTTTKSTLRLHKEGIDFDSLSKTFQDAIVVTRSLQVQYLWIDSLCIVQDDAEDWRKESAVMGEIYERAYCTIAGSSAIDGSVGLFISRPAQEVLKLPCAPDAPHKGYFYLTTEPPPAVKELDGGPLNSRAWVLQERVLSRRTIHFAKNQVYWSCKMLGIDESGASYLDSFGHFDWKNMPREQEWKVLSPHSKAMTYFHGCWFSAVTRYTACGMTRPSDRLPGLEGLARQEQKRTGIEYFQGHWIDGSVWFLQSLLWYATKDRALRRREDLRAPSWSWASLDGPVDFLETGECIGDMYCQLLNIADVVRDPDSPMFACVRARGFIGTSTRSAVRATEDVSYQPAMHMGYGANKRAYNIWSWRSRPGWVCFDLDECEPENFDFIPVIEQRNIRPRAYLGIAVQKCDGIEDERTRYKRIGAGTIYLDRWSRSSVRQNLWLI